MNLKKAREDRKYWQELANLVEDWDLLGWTYRNSATYITPSQWGPNHTDTVYLTGVQRDNLISSITKGKENG